MTPSWYDVLGVDADADAQTIRDAWKAMIADLEPTDGRFRAANAAAEVLLDPDRRAAYDATLVPSEPEPAPESPADGPLMAADAAAAEADQDAAVAAARTGRTLPRWLVVGLFAAAAVMFIAAAALWFTRDGGDPDTAAAEAQRSAEQAMAVVLSYDATRLDDDRAAAKEYLTEDFAREYDRLFDGIVAQNAPELGARVESVVLGSGLIRISSTTAQVFVLLDRAVTSRSDPEPRIFRDHVTVSLERVGDAWRVDQMSTGSE
ncbi:J domain-containing protein [Nocardioides limicola]|uniref:J domain-containing protein n=1 Tax=Nocardioides limicola TaxID=2803368 RepID=UPI00193C4C00|nr:DnaJ domain-containing protein [Nocardioides sp. DJM-14]